MPHASASIAVSSRTRHPSSRDLRILRVVVAVFTLVALVAAAVFVLPSAGLLLFLAGLALLFALPFAVVASVADALEPFQ